MPMDTEDVTILILIFITSVLSVSLIALIINTLFSTNTKSETNSKASHEGANKIRHPLDVNTLIGHGGPVNGLCFSSDGRCLATACDDGVVRVFKLDDVASKSVRIRTIIFPAEYHPCGVSFYDYALVVACRGLVGSSLYMYSEEKPDAANSKRPLPVVKWAHHKVHDKRNIISFFGTKATYGNGDGSTILASSSEETDIIIWHGKTGKILGSVDTDQLKNNMAIISPNGRFVAAATFTADVKVWEIVYSKDSSVKEVSKVMQLKGHTTAVTWLCFSPNSEQIITASKDGTIRIWNLNVRYHLDENPKTLKVFPIPLHDSEGNPLHYDRLSISPDGKILAATHGSTLQWLCVESGCILDTCEKAHDSDIAGIEWAPKPLSMGDKKVLILATASMDNKVKLWEAPSI